MSFDWSSLRVMSFGSVKLIGITFHMCIKHRDPFLCTFRHYQSVQREHRSAAELLKIKLCSIRCFSFHFQTTMKLVAESAVGPSAGSVTSGAIMQVPDLH